MSAVSNVIDWLAEGNNSQVILVMIALLTGMIAFGSWIVAYRDRRDRSRPNMVAELRRASDNDSAYDLVVRNAGITVARDVQVTFDPPLPTSDPTGDIGLVKCIHERYSEAIPSIAPGQEFTNIWWSTRPIHGRENPNALPTPDDVTVTISFKRRAHQLRPFRETYVLRSHTIAWGTRSVSSTSIKGRMGAISDNLASIAKSLEELTEDD